MAEGQDEAEKTFEPTERKLADARRKGDVVKSQDLLATSAYVGLVIGLALLATGALDEAMTALSVFLEKPHDLIPLFFEGSSAPVFMSIFGSLADFFTFLLVTPILAVLLCAAAQRCIVFAPMKIEPKLSRISPIEMAKNKFGMSGLFEFAKSTLKLIVFSAILFAFIYFELEDIVSTSKLEPRSIVIYLYDLIVYFLILTIIVSALIGAVDYIFQSFEHNRKLRMSRKEIMDEMKESEGDPYLKQERQRRAHENVSQQSISEVDKADVVITNPTHYAVALHWSREPGSAPTCVAKGVDELAHAIRRRAEASNIAIHEDPPTARAVFASTDVGEEIPPELYAAVAVSIKFAEKLREKARTRGY